MSGVMVLQPSETGRTSVRALTLIPPKDSLSPINAHRTILRMPTSDSNSSASL